MGFINDLKSAWDNGKQEARMEIIREFFAYIYGIKYKDAIVSKEWYPYFIFADMDREAKG